MAETDIAEPITCVRCSGKTLLSVVGNCADCIGDMGLRHPEEYAEFRKRVFEKFSNNAG